MGKSLLCASLFFLFLFLLVSASSGRGWHSYTPGVYGDTAAPKKAAAVAEAAKKTAADKAKLLKKIGKLLSFRANMQEKQKKLVVKTLGELNLYDSILAGSLPVRLRIDTVMVQEDDHFKQLSKRIDSLFIILSMQSASVPPPSSKPDEDQERAATAGDVAPVSLLFKEIANEAGNKEKRKALSLIKKLSAGSRRDSVTIAAGDSSATYRMKKRVDICGYYNAGSGYNYSGTDFSFISTLIYDSMLVVSRQGNITATRNWNEKLVRTAKAAGTSVVYTVTYNSPGSLGAFLSDRKAIENFAANVATLQKENEADGINIHFTSLTGYDRELFTEFVTYFEELCNKNATAFKVYITLPVYDDDNAYDITALGGLTDRFCVDFSNNLTTGEAALAPLAGKERTSLSTSVAYYLNQQVSPEKFMVTFGYKGAMWRVQPAGTFIRYFTYAAIRNRTDAMVMYDEASNSAYIADTTVYRKRKTVYLTWFDDENTLSAKFDFVLQNGLGGVGFSYLGYDGSYAELWDLLLYKFVSVDSALHAPAAPRQLSFFERIHDRWMLYYYILHNPCETCFENGFDDEAEKDSLHQYIKDLRIDSLVNAKNIKAPSTDSTAGAAQQKIFVTPFTYLTQEMNILFLCTTLFFLLLTAACAYLYVHSMQERGDRWRYKKVTGWILTFLFIFFVWSFFDYLFTTSWIPYFGVSGSWQNSAEANFSDPCQPEPDCVNMPVNTLLEIILAAAFIGFILTRYLLLPLLKKEETP